MESNIVTQWDCGSTLYDSYELVSLWNMMERVTTASHPPLLALTDHTSTSKNDGKREIPRNPTSSSEFVFENVNVKCQCWAVNKHPFRRLFRMGFSFLRSPVLRTANVNRRTRITV